MRSNEINVGTIVWTNVNGERRQCTVTRKETYRPTTRWALRTIATRFMPSKDLRALRSSRQLHVCGHNIWASMTETIECDPCTTCADTWKESFSSPQHMAFEADRRDAIAYLTAHHNSLNHKDGS